MKKSKVIFLVLTMLCSASAFADCSTEDTIALAKSGYSKETIHEMCTAKSSAKGGSKNRIRATQKRGDGESKRIAEKLSRVFGAQFHLTEQGTYTRGEIDKSTSARLEDKRLTFELQIQSTHFGEGGARSSGSNNISSSALLADLDPESIKVKGEMFLGSYNYSIEIECKGGSRCAKRSDVNGTVDTTGISGDFMPSRHSEVMGMVNEIKYLIMN